MVYHWSHIRRERRAGVWSQGGCSGLWGCTKTPGLWQPESFAVISVLHTGLLCALSRHTSQMLLLPAVPQQCKALIASSPHHQRRLFSYPSCSLCCMLFDLWATMRLGKTFSILCHMRRAELGCLVREDESRGGQHESKDTCSLATSWGSIRHGVCIQERKRERTCVYRVVLLYCWKRRRNCYFIWISMLFTFYPVAEQHWQNKQTHKTKKTHQQTKNRKILGKGLPVSAFHFPYNSSFVQWSPRAVFKAISACKSPTTWSNRPPSAKHMHRQIIQISLPLCTWQHATVQWPNIRRVCG